MGLDTHPQNIQHPMSKPILWFAYYKEPYHNPSEPSFFSPDSYEWAQYIETHWQNIAAELLEFIKERTLQPYFVGQITNNQTGWQTLSFRTWGIDVKENRATCPFISDLLSRFPQMVSASVNMLKAGSVIHPHQGDTNAIFRCHLGIEIPAGLPECGFEVDEEKRGWEQGKLLIFCDAHRHWAWNKSEGDRVIFLFDIVRPEFLDIKTGISIRVRALLLYQLLMQKIPFLPRVPRLCQLFVFHCIRLLLYVLCPIQKRTGTLLKHS